MENRKGINKAWTIKINRYFDLIDSVEGRTGGGQ
jgi:hypothetical protein